MQLNTSSRSAMANDRQLVQTILADTSDDLYVLNVSDLPVNNRATDKGGDIVFRCTSKGSNTDHLIRIPQSFVPVNLSQQSPCNKEDLLKSADMSRLLITKRIRLITNEQAIAMIEKDQITLAEYDRVMAKALRINTDTELGDNAPELADLTNINNELQVAVDAYKSGAYTLSRLTASVRQMERDLRSEDYAYLRREVPDYNQ